MGTLFGDDLLLWLSAFELPAMAGLLALVLAARSKADSSQHKAAADLADFKLEVARSYASLALLKDVELRLTEHLVRIEAKLDGRAPR